MTNTESPLRAQNTVGGQRSRAKRRPHCPYFIPRVESLEERIVLDNRSAGMAGIMARGLRLADNVTALTGQNINIGQVEIGRPGLRTIPAVAFDDVNHSNATVVPQRVFFRDVSAGPNSELVYWQDGHATAVAGVIIANAVEPGVAPQAKLYASASSTVNAAQEVYYTDVLRSLQRVARPALAGEAAVQVRAINFSAAIPSPITGPGVGGNPPPISVDGTSLLSKSVDWLARL